METNQVNGQAQGAESDVLETSEDQILKWLTRDLGACITFLRAIHDDVELRQMMATWFKGRIINAKNARDNVDPRQLDVFGNPKSKK